tara:strand:- start:216 stop:392 length:177 start_codon:yes stop_codon:yes gene_type:complete
MKQLFIQFGKDTRGATAIEYALIASGIALAVIAIVYLIGADLLGLYTAVQTDVTGRVP